jgi:hypothetical protein
MQSILGTESDGRHTIATHPLRNGIRFPSDLHFDDPPGPASSNLAQPAHPSISRRPALLTPRGNEASAAIDHASTSAEAG